MQFTFGKFVLDGARFELRSAGRKVDVQPKVLRVLLYLAENCDRVVGVDELLATLWRGETVSAASVRRAVKSARQALGEKGESSATIRTVHGYGYQFIAEPLAAGRSPAGPRHSPKAEANAQESLSTALEDAWLDAEQARGHALLLSGEAGAGKSAALHQLTAFARERGGICWVARGAEVEGAPAYWPFVSLLRDALQHGESTELPWRKLIGYGATDLAQALPDLREALGVAGSVPPSEIPTARFRFFDSMLGFLRRVAAHRPLLLVIDDLTLADGPTVELFSFLATHAEGSRLLLAAARRPVPRPSAELAALGRHARHHSVPALSARDIEAVIVQRWGSGSVEPAQLAKLSALTAGNALLLEQLLLLCRPSSAHGMPRWELLAHAAEHHTIRRAVERLTGQLSEGARNCVETAALLGCTCSARVLAELLGEPAQTVRGYLSEAEECGLLRAHGTDCSQFRHDLVHQVLARTTDAARRKQLHARAALALEALCALGEAQPGDVAHHALCAGDYERGVEFSVRAARAALHQSDAELALRYYEQALANLAPLPSDPHRHATMLLEKAAAETEAGSFAAARLTHLEAGAIAQRLSSKELLTKIALGLGTPGLRDYDGRELALLRDAFEQLRPEDDGYALIAAAYARALVVDHDSELRRHTLAVATEAARKLRQPIVRASALVLCHEAMSEREPQQDREAVARDATAIARSRSHPRLLLRGACAQLRDALHVGDIQSVDVSLTMIEQLSKQLGDPFSRWHELLYRSMRAWLDGRVELSMMHAEDALQSGLLAGEPIARHYYLVQLSRCLRLLGESERQREVIYEASMRYPSSTGWRCAAALSEVDTGRLDAAGSIFRELMAEGLPSVCRGTFVLSTLCPLAELCGWVGEAEHARQLYEALSPYAQVCGIVPFGISTYGPVSRHLGILAAAAGEYDRALEHLSASSRKAALMGSPTFICLTAATHAYVALEMSGRPDLRAQALTELDLARSLAQQHRFAWVERICRGLAGQGAALNTGDGHCAHSS